jgi:hypothetical protein
VDNLLQKNISEHRYQKVSNSYEKKYNLFMGGGGSKEKK